MVVGVQNTFNLFNYKRLKIASIEVKNKNYTDLGRSTN